MFHHCLTTLYPTTIQKERETIYYYNHSSSYGMILEAVTHTHTQRAVL